MVRSQNAKYSSIHSHTTLYLDIIFLIFLYQTFYLQYKNMLVFLRKEIRLSRRTVTLWRQKLRLLIGYIEHSWQQIEKNTTIASVEYSKHFEHRTFLSAFEPKTFIQTLTTWFSGDVHRLLSYVSMYLSNFDLLGVALVFATLFLNLQVTSKLFIFFKRNLIVWGTLMTARWIILNRYILLFLYLINNNNVCD